MANYKLYGEPEAFPADTDKLRRGDIVGVTGHPAKTKKGELSVVPQQVHVLTPCLHMLPSMHYGLKDKVWRGDGGTGAKTCAGVCVQCEGSYDR